MHVDVAVAMVEDEVDRSIANDLIGDLAVVDGDVLRLGQLHVAIMAHGSKSPLPTRQRLLEGVDGVPRRPGTCQTTTLLCFVPGGAADDVHSEQVRSETSGIGSTPDISA